MPQKYNSQLFRLSAVLYADNNYEVSSNTILRKVIECALLSNENPLSIHELIDFTFSTYHLNLSEEEIVSIPKKENIKPNGL